MDNRKMLSLLIGLSLFLTIITVLSTLSGKREPVTAAPTSVNQMYNDSSSISQPPKEEQSTPESQPSDTTGNMYLGKWQDRDWDAEVIIYLKDNKKLSMKYVFGDGDYVADDYYIRRISDGKAVLKPFQDDFGEYYMLDIKTSELELYDKDGYASTLKPIIKVPLDILNDNVYNR